ncbi:hypothetical protein [Saccharopolyspora cebuensis]|uniref:Uncharacterized protein n=1 Tax=Saccharopolyspora cebuensis TaxID=418759 RepID=A0ABV4CDX7_9PSEU
MPALTRRRRDEPDVPLMKQTVGNALVVSPERRMTPEAQEMALSVAPDTEHDMVVVDLPGDLPISAWDSVAALLPRHRRGVRLVLGGRSREATALAGQWLSERLGRTVVAPDGVIFRGTGGTLFVHSGKGSGWVRFRPGKAPEWEAKRFPRPMWDAGVVEPWPTSSVGVAEPIPGGVWIHPAVRDARTGGHWDRLTRGMPCQPEVLTIVLGCPGAPALSLDDVARFWRRLDPALRDRVRFVQYGPVHLPEGDALGQALADLLHTKVVCYSGMPVGSRFAPDVYTMLPDGELGWHAFARELGYAPRGHAAHQDAPVLLSHRAPFAGLEQVAPAVYWYTPDAVLEVVQSGLWVRPPEGAQNADAVRAEPGSAEVNVLSYDAVDERRAARMRRLAEDVLARLDPATRVRCRIAPASEAGRGAVRVTGPAGGALGAAPAPDAPAAGSAAAPPEAITDVFAPAVDAPPPVEAPSAGPTASPVSASPGPAPGTPALDVPPPAGTTAPPEAAAPPQPAAPPEAAAPPETTAPPERTAPPATGDEPASAMPLRLESSPVPDIGAPAEPPGAPAEPPSRPEPEAVPEPEPRSEPEPRAEPEARAEPGARAAEERPAPTPAPRAQPVPQPGASALLPGTGIAEERAWLRKSLSREFDATAHSVSRIISEHPGFQNDARSSSDVLTDTVAVRLYLQAHGAAVDTALRTGANGPHVPFARCVVSGLSTLPSHRGATVFPASPSTEHWELYRKRQLVTEWGFTHALTEPGAEQGGEVDVLVWSMTARRTKLLELDGADRVDHRVVFAPGTNFKVLELVEPGAEGERGRILLRELAHSEVDEEGRVTARAALDELAGTSLRRCVERWAAGRSSGVVGEAARARFGALPGLV